MILQPVWDNISYWYFRYLMVTELYMVEKWERNVIYSIALVLFFLLWYFNVKYIIFGMSEARSFLKYMVA